MSSRVTKRAPAPSRKALEAARHAQQAQEASRAKNRTGFKQFGSQHAAQVESRGGLEARGADDDSEEEVTVLPPQKPSTQTQQPPKKQRVSKKWTPWANLVLANAGLKNEVWHVSGSKLLVSEKWENCHKDLLEEPYTRVFSGKSRTSIQSHFDSLVSQHSKASSDAIRESGGGTVEDATGTDEERRTKAELEKTLTAIVDAKAAAKHEVAESKQKKAADAANNSLLGSLSVQQGNKRCGPGARATSFAEALAADDLALKQLQTAGGVATSNASSTSSGRSSPASSASDLASGRFSPATSVCYHSDDRSSPATEPAKIWPPLGTELAKELGEPTIARLKVKVGVSGEEADHFLNGGFTRVQLTHEKAVDMMSFVIETKLRKARDDVDMDIFIDGLEEEGDEEAEVPGFDGLLLARMTTHYGADKKDFYIPDDAYRFANGWMLADKPTSAKLDVQIKRLATLLVGSPSSTPSSTAAPTSGATAASAGIPISAGGRLAGGSSSMGPSRQGGLVEGNRGRRSRSNKNKLDEDGLNGFLQEQMKYAQQQAERLAAQKREDADRKEASSRAWMVAQMEHDRKNRQDEREHERQLRKDEREAERAQAIADQEHQLKVLQLQVQLANASNKNNLS